MVLVEVSDSSELKCSLICVDNLWGVSELSLDFLKDRVKVRASCNGLLCCSSIPDKGVYYVCNPMTREFRLLPRSRERPVTRFYPDGEATLVGLGCNLSVQKFNVVLAGYHRTFGRRPDGTFICMVFDSDTNKWRKFVSFQDDRIALMNRNRVVFVHGSLHWLTSGCSYILSLDLNCNVWRKISLPDEVIYGAGYRAHLLELDGSLSVIQISEAWMKIWVMKDYESEQWHLVDGVSLRCVRGMVPGIFPISQTSECVFLATYKQVLVYQRKSRVWKEMYSVKNSPPLPLCGSSRVWKEMCSVKNSPPLPLWFLAHAFQTANGEHGFFASGFAHSEVERDDPLGESRQIACKRCGNFHLWVLAKKTKSQARWCQAFIVPPSISFINHHLFTKDSIQLITIVPDLDLPNGKMMLILNFWAFCLKECKDIHQTKDGHGWVEQSSQPFFFGLLQKIARYMMPLTGIFVRE
ncbi:hypothetical protein OIU84_021067 [Salix udensis]|uniref:F-box protein n=1 Tax=Salix udensis TaxID=889485 RepID=A0AAD6KTT7_9ROSI|nr:hypothetical protein OIU84_021067 [Salix udensis]